MSGGKEERKLGNKWKRNSEIFKLNNEGEK